MANEKRLIDANALMDAFRNYMVERHDRVRCASEENCKVCDRECLWRRVVKNAPTVDAVEVVHGRWEKYWSEEYWTHFHSCSVCFGHAPIKEETAHDEVLSNYCPNCGAKMDGDKNV